MIDWYVIEFLYPQAFKRFESIMFPHIGIISISTLEYYDIKKLYRFFDKEGIFLTVDRYHTNMWVFTISLENGVVVVPTQESRPNREEIECDGFIECFKILDKKIIDKCQ